MKVFITNAAMALFDDQLIYAAEKGVTDGSGGLVPNV